MKWILSVGISLAFAPMALASVPDSVGFVVKGGKTYVKHEVEKSEGLFGIARKYSASVPDIRKANPGMADALNLGQIVLVPTKGSASTAAAAAPRTPATSPRPATTATSSAKQHTVAKGETLYRISKNYGVSVDDIKTWNGMSDNALELGATIWVSKPTTAAATPPPPRPSERTVAAIEAPKVIREPRPGTSPTKTGSEPIVISKPKGDSWEDADAPTTATVIGGTPAVAEDAVPEGMYEKEMNESGIALAIEDAGSEDKNKNLCLHRTAPINTLIKLTNPANNKTTFVKVVGKLTTGGDDANTKIKVTKSVAQKLGVVDRNFRVSMYYKLVLPKTE